MIPKGSIRNTMNRSQITYYNPPFPLHRNRDNISSWILTMKNEKTINLYVRDIKRKNITLNENIWDGRDLIQIDSSIQTYKERTKNKQGRGQQWGENTIRWKQVKNLISILFWIVQIQNKEEKTDQSYCQSLSSQATEVLRKWAAA